MKIKRRLAAAAAAAALSLGVGVVTSDSASASATNCAWYGKGIKYGVYNGSFCANINGSGTYISTVTGSFGTTLFGVDTICYPSMKIDFYDRNGRWLTYRQGGQAAGCFPWAVNVPPTIPVWWDMWQADGGSARVALQSYGQDRVYVWFGIHR